MTERQRELSERLAMPEALLSQTDVAVLGLPRRGVDAVFRALDIVVLPGFSRPFVRVSDYLDLVERPTYRDDRSARVTRSLLVSAMILDYAGITGTANPFRDKITVRLPHEPKTEIARQPPSTSGPSTTCFLTATSCLSSCSTNDA